MVRYRFGRDDLLRTRFAVAPLMELIGALYVLRDPERSAVHEPWVRRVAPHAARLDLSLLEVNDAGEVTSAALLRTARKLMDGVVFA